MLQKTDRDECEGKVTRTTKEREKKKRKQKVFWCVFLSLQAQNSVRMVCGVGGKKTHKKKKQRWETN